MAVPDKRYCFDAKRELTSISKIIDAKGNKIHTKGSVAEYYLKVVKKNGEIAWSSNEDDATFENVHSVYDAVNGMKVVEKGEYIDIHNWVFTPDSFRGIMSDLEKLDFIGLEEISFFDTEGHEFFISYEKRKVR